MTKQDSTAQPEAPRVSEGPTLLSDTADLLRALAYTEDTLQRIELQRIAKNFIAGHEAALGGARVPRLSRERAWEIDREWEIALFRRSA